MQRKRDVSTFIDREEAGRRLAERLRGQIEGDPVVLGLPRGGVPVAFQVARGLAAPLDVIVVSRLGIPWQPEVAMGALAEGGTRVINDRIIKSALISPHDLDTVERHERLQLDERVRQLRGDRQPGSLGGHTAVIVDDGLATGSSALAACQVARDRGAEQVVVAVPVSSREALHALLPVADDLIVLYRPRHLLGVGQAYLDFGQVDDDDMIALLRAAETGPSLTTDPDLTDPGLTEPSSGDGPPRVEDVVLETSTATLAGWSAVPPGARELVIIAHDSSRERHSARSRYLSRILNAAGLATLLVDLLTEDEDSHGNRFLAIDLLSARLVDVTRRIGPRFDRVDYLADGVAAAVALQAAAEYEIGVHAVVCLGGRPELASRPGAVHAPILFVVGEEDSAGRRLSNQVLGRLSCPAELAIVPGAGPRFREPGALRRAGIELRDWLLAPPGQHPAGEHDPQESSGRNR